MLPRPTRRNARSSICDSDARVRLAPPGFRNGRMPSSTRYRANAAQRSFQCIAARTGPSVPGFLQVLEEFAIGRKHQHVTLLAERAAIRLQPAIERIELGVAAVRLR